MNEPTRTTTALLEGLEDAANAPAWREFDQRYRPLLIGLARRLGLADDDAADVAQDAIVRFVEEYRDGRYDRQRGRLRSWLLTFVRYRVATLRRARANAGPVHGASAVDDLPDEATMTVAWEEERRRVVLRAALDELRTATRTDPRTIRAFELLYVHALPVAVVADELGMSAHDVYLAKSRVAQRLRAMVARLDASYDGEG